MQDGQRGRVVLFGATGYTGRLTADALAGRLGGQGGALVLAGRDLLRLEEAARGLAQRGLPAEVALADARDEQAVRALLAPGDVLVSTVGPFALLGHAAVAAATDAGVAYLDATGEPSFVADVFTRYGPRASRTGARLLPAFGYDFVPGNVAAALALAEAGEPARRVDVGYFLRGTMPLSGGTMASAGGFMLDSGLVWRGGGLRRERSAARVRSFHLGGRDRQAVSVAGSEHLALPRLRPDLIEVNVHLGWSGAMSRPLQAASAAARVALAVPAVRDALGRAARRLAPGSSGGPTAAQRARTRSVAVAETFTVDDRLLSRVVMEGPDPYGLTASLLAWGALAALDGHVRGAGALGPVDAFGLPGLVEGARQAGLVVVDG